MTSQDVLSYLSHHPDFFVKYPDILLDLQLPKQASQGNLSLMDYQNERLSQQGKTLNIQLDELLAVAEFNENSQLQTHQFILKIIAQKDRDSLNKLVQTTLAKQFKLAQSQLIIWSEQPNISTQQQVELLRYVDENEVYFGLINPEHSHGIFTKHPKSVALVPLKNTRIGLLALSSKDERFLAPSISPILLTLIANMAYIILQGFEK